MVQMMTERGIVVAHTTILRWVQRYVPEFEKRWNRYARPVNGSWRCDETYIKVKGRWTYLYRAVDKHGSTVDFQLSETTGRRRGQTLLPQSDERQRDASGDHPRRGLASGHPGTEIRGQSVSASADPIQ